MIAPGGPHEQTIDAGACPQCSIERSRARSADTCGPSRLNRTWGIDCRESIRAPEMTGRPGLADGSRLAKDAPRVASMGDLDELNALLGRGPRQSAPRRHPRNPRRRAAHAVRHRRRARDSFGEHRGRCEGEIARSRPRRSQRRPAATEGIHPAGRRRGSQRRACRPCGVPPGRARHRRPCPGRARERGEPTLRQSPVGLPVPSPPAFWRAAKPGRSTGGTSVVAARPRSGAPARCAAEAPAPDPSR